MQRKICAVYGDDAVTDRMCQKWFVKFCAGDFSLDDVPWSRRQVEVDSDQTETLTGNDQHSTMWDIANIHKISKLMKLLVKMKNVSFLLWKKLNGLFGQPNKNCFHVLFFCTGHNMKWNYRQNGKPWGFKSEWEAGVLVLSLFITLWRELCPVFPFPARS